jgi:uncharacterized protein YprB with RNaseH-like and TPR domain
MKTERLGRKLERYADLLGTAGKSRSPAAKPPERYQRLAQAVNGRLNTSHGGACVVVRHRLERDCRHGQFDFSSRFRRETLPLSAFTVEAKPGEVPLDSLLFLDTETTGLGGAGVVPFVVGCGFFAGGRFEVRQYLLPDYPDEAALLEMVLQEFESRPALVTYNGKAFDAPILRDRLIVNRVARDLPVTEHLDVLHATRRLFRRRLADCSLVNIEKELFDVTRNDDIPGYLIPSVYFEWLSSERTDQLSQVLEHNRLDIVTLACLTIHLAGIFETEGGELNHPKDIH